MANKTSYNKVPNNKTPNNKSKGKKAYIQKKKVMGFDLTDTESKIAFSVFIVIAIVLSALLIAGFALGFSRCGTPEIPEEGSESAPPASAAEYADIDDVIALVENTIPSENEYNYSNGVFSLSYDPETVSLFDRFEESKRVTVTKESGKPTGLTVTYMEGMEGTDPGEYLDKFVNMMAEKNSVTPESGLNAVSDDQTTRTSERSFTMYLSDYPVRVITKMTVRGDKALVTQMTLGGEQTAEEMKALIDTYNSVVFNGQEQ